MSISRKLIIAIILAFAIFKSFTASITHDEAYTYNHFVSSYSLLDVTINTDHSNNHILNTLLTKLTTSIFGASEITVRLPSLISLFFLLLFFLKTSIYKNTSLAAFVFILSIVFLNPYVFEFFSLSRGYGLLYCFAIMGLLIFANNPNSKTMFTFIETVSLSLMVLANFTGLLILSAYLIVKTISLFHQKQILSPSHWIPIILPVGGLFTVIYNPLQLLSQKNEFYFGGTKGFFQDTVNSFLWSSSFNNLKVMIIIQFIAGFLFLLALIFTVICGINNKWSLHANPSLKILLILTFTVIINLLQHHFLGTPFLIQRTAIIYYALFSTFIISAFLSVRNFKIGVISIPIELVTTIMFITYFVSKFSPNSYLDWKYDANSKQIIEKINLEGKKRNKKLSLGTSFLFEPSMNFYITTKNLEFVNKLKREEFKDNYSFYYVTEKELQNTLFSKKTILAYYTNSNTYLIQ